MVKYAMEKKKLVPNYSVVDDKQNTYALWDFRQKSNVILIVDPQASLETVERWQKIIKAEEKQWIWLQATVLIVRQAPAELTPAVYLIDRYGQFMTSFPIDAWTAEDLEREFVYHEARHC